MKCPQCGTEFNTPVEQCFTCGWDFSAERGDFVPRTSKLAVAALVLGVLSLFTFYLPLGLAVILGAMALHKIRKSRGRLTGRRMAMAGILIPGLSLPILVIIGIAVWTRDAGPVPNEFTEADFKQVKPENEITYSVLRQLKDKGNDPNGAPSIGLSESDVDLLEEVTDEIIKTEESQIVFELVQQRADKISYLWGKSFKGRKVLNELHQYNEIADLTPATISAEMPYLYDLRLLCQINVLHSLLLIENENYSEACQQLIRFDTLIQNHSIFARSMIAKLVCYSAFNMDLLAANTAANHPSISDEALLSLRAHFGSLNGDSVSLKNTFIFEYLVFKNSFSETFDQVVGSRLYKQNSACRYYDGICRNFILKDQAKLTFALF